MSPSTKTRRAFGTIHTVMKVKASQVAEDVVVDISLAARTDHEASGEETTTVAVAETTMEEVAEIIMEEGEETITEAGEVIITEEAVEGTTETSRITKATDHEKRQSVSSQSVRTTICKRNTRTSSILESTS